MITGIPTTYEGVKVDFEDFTREVLGDVLIEKVNFTRATFKDSGI